MRHYFSAALLIAWTASVVVTQDVSSAIDQILSVYDVNANGLVEDGEWDSLYDAFFPAHDEHNEHNHDHEDGDDHDDGDHDHEDEHPDHGDHLQARRSLRKRQPDATLCHPADEIFDMYDTSARGALNRTELESAVVVIFSMLTVPGKCIPEPHEQIVANACSAPQPYEAWLGGVVASIIISLIALVMVAVLPTNTKFLNVYLIPLISFAIGTLIGDACLHLIPEGLGAHSHGSEGEPEEQSEHFYLGPASFVVLGIMLFLVLERVLSNFHHHGGDLTHHRDEREHQVELADVHDGEALPRTPEEEKPTTLTGVEHESSGKHIVQAENIHVEAPEPTRRSIVARFLPVGRSLAHIKPSGWMVIFADGVHNFVDGLAIGLSFSQSFSIGLATSIATFCHEVPQEIGDFGLLIGSGFTKRQAMFFNFMSALTCVIGTLIGLGVGESVENVNVWLLPLVAGGFLYIALVDMMPLVLKVQQWKMIAIDGLCMIIGYVIMLIIALYAEGISLCGEGHTHSHEH